MYISESFPWRPCLLGAMTCLLMAKSIFKEISVYIDSKTIDEYMNILNVHIISSDDLFSQDIKATT